MTRKNKENVDMHCKIKYLQLTLSTANLMG